MDEQRGWQERYGFVGWEAQHFLVVISFALLILAPFFALVNGDAGFIALMSAFALFLLAVMMSGETETDRSDDGQSH